MSDNPWDNTPAQPEPTPAPTEPPAQVTVTNQAPQVVQASGDEVTLTFKESGGYDAAWVVIRAASVSSANAILDDFDGLSALLNKTKQVAGFFRGGAPSQGNGGGGGGARKSNAPAAAQQAPNGEKRYCSHGEMEYKTGNRKSDGKPYALFSCTGPRDEQCKAQYPSK